MRFCGDGVRATGTFERSPSALDGDPGMMWSVSRSEVTEMPELSELSEPEWCWCSRSMEKYVCRALWVCWEIEKRNLAEHGTEFQNDIPPPTTDPISVFCGLRTIKLYQCHVFYVPSSLGVVASISFCNRRGFSSSRQIRTMRHVVTGRVRCNGVLNMCNIPICTVYICLHQKSDHRQKSLPLP